jgi:hypothetical protein
LSEDRACRCSEVTEASHIGVLNIGGKLPFDSHSLPQAVKALFELNNYSVEQSVHVHGAEIDLVATPIDTPFASPVYIEATIEYVDNDKYGKDVGKLALVSKKISDAKLLIVSSSGFTPNVKERAQETGIETLTYQNLFMRFERFERYVSLVLDDHDFGAELARLSSIYEEPYFDDSSGTSLATDWLGKWRTDEEEQRRWLVVVGEYGTGKTALTKVLQRRWTQEYHDNPALPIPFRIELRDFNRQFDARGLLHHFLDHNRLGHVPVDFVFSLIRSGRIVLLLDGYDEMAQYLSARERRVCLEALANISAGGARGILTSRPNYFSEAEELQVFDILYSSLEAGSYHLTAADKSAIEREREIDDLIVKQILNRYERALRDLSPEQTADLVGRILSSDPDGRMVVLDILRRVFRTTEEGAAVSLSGKPVIIGYLLDVVEQLKDRVNEESAPSLTEWDVYKLVVDQLMIRDLRQAGRVGPQQRRSFLQALSVWLSQRDHAVITEMEFRALISKHFKSELRLRFSDDKSREIENYFEDLRRSGTLSRSTDQIKPGWKFSHNSLREFLLSEKIVDGLETGDLEGTRVPISDAMRLFAASRDLVKIRHLLSLLVRNWGQRAHNPGVSSALLLLWDGALRLFPESRDPVQSLIKEINGGQLAMNDVSIERIKLSSSERPAKLDQCNFSRSGFSDIGLNSASLRGANFRDCVLENVNFSDSDLREGSFNGSILIDIDFSGALLASSDFRSIDKDCSILVDSERSSFGRRINGPAAIGYLKYSGAATDNVDPYLVYCNHPKFFIVEKVCSKLAEQTMRQRRGVVQRGAARQDIPFASSFVDYLIKMELVYVPNDRTDLISATPKGRTAFASFAEQRQLIPEIVKFLQDNP